MRSSLLQLHVIQRYWVFLAEEKKENFEQIQI